MTRSDLQAWADRAVELAGRLARPRRRNPRTERLALFAALGIFVFATATAIASLPERDDPFRVASLVGVVLLVPVGMLFNAAEYQLSARVLRHRVRLADALRVAVLARAFNLLPIPGAALVRTRELAKLGSSLKGAAGSTVIVGIGFFALSLVFAGVVVTPLGDVLLGLALLAAGLGGLLFVFAVLRARRGTATAGRLVGLLTVIETGSMATKSARILILLPAVGADPDPAQAVVVSLAAVLALSVGVFPSGLGIRELFAALVSPLVGLDPAIGIVVSALDRVIGLIVNLLLALGFLLRQRWRDRAAT